MSCQNVAVPVGTDQALSGIAASGLGKFPNPFFDIASEYIPSDLKQIFEFAEYIYMGNGTYRSAARRVTRYFLTDIVLEGQSDDEREDYEDFLSNKLHLKTQLAEIGDEFMVYGNVFLSVYFPFDRYLVWRVHDISGRVEYYYEPDARFVEKLKAGNRFFLNDTPWSLITCCSKSGKDKKPLYKFDNGQLYHFKEATLSGLPIKGWGIPPVLPNFKLAYYIQILRRYDEAVALDYIVPFRILHPTQSAPGGMNTDPLMSMNMDAFLGHMKSMVKAKRLNMTDIQIAPFPIGYQMLGGEAKMLTPKDLIQSATDELLNAVGFPAELYRGSLQIQAAPTALRLFEKTWSSLVDGYDDIISWVLNKITKYYGWGEMTGSMRSVTLADDLERKALNFQAAAGMDISKDTAFKPMGIDYMAEQRKVVQEQREIQDLQREAMEEQEAMQMQGQGGGGGEGGPGGQPGATPGDVHEQAKEMAYNLVVQTPESLRRGELMKIKNSNPTLHALVTQEMDNLRQEMSRQGQAMVLQQEKQGSAGVRAQGAGELPSPLKLGLLINSQIMDIDRKYMRKIATDINIPGVRDAYRFIKDKRLGNK